MNKRFSSWDKEWDSLDAESVARDEGGTTTAAVVAAGGGAGGAVISSSGNGAGSRACLPADGKVRGGGGGGALTGWFGWVPVTTIVLGLMLAAIGVRSSSGSSRGAAPDGAADRGD